MKRIFLFALILLGNLAAMAGEVYRDNHVRFTVIDEGTVRMEYAPDGRFVDNKSFVAVQREYPSVPFTVKETSKQVTIITSKMKLVYKKSDAPFSAANLTITAAKNLGTSFVWKPGMKQQHNLKGTYRTLDGYDGEIGRDNQPIPLEDGLLATDGWTLLDDSQSLLFNGDKDWDWVTRRESAEGAQDWYFMAYGHNYKEALKSYTKFAGKVPLPPRYTFGYWWSRYWSYSEQDFRSLIDHFHHYNIPLDVLVIDMDWHPISPEAGGGWTGWDWNENLFPNYKKFLHYLDEEGVKTTMNLHPAEGVRTYEKKYKEVAEDILSQESNTVPALSAKAGEHIEWLGSDKVMIKSMFKHYLHPYMEDGVDFWWLDWQQWLNDKQIPELSNTWWCNYVFFTDMEHSGNKRPMLYHRWGGLGNHRYQIGFSGDAYITWESLQFLPYFNSTSSNVLYGYWSHDIGGHQSRDDKWGTTIDPELYTRAMQMGAYLPVIRSHSTKDPKINKEPWSFNRETQERLMKVINDRYALVPYIYTMAREDYETGISLCRPLYYDYPEAPEAYENKTQYLFGDRMMIAPAVTPVDSDGFSNVKVWLPAGNQWLEYETGTMFDGGQTVERSFTLDEYPVYIKAGSILPYYGKLKNLSGTSQAVTVRVFPGGNEGKFLMYEDNGEDREYAEHYATTPLSYQRNGQQLTVTIGQRKGDYKDMPAEREYSIALPCQMAPAKVVMNGKELDFEYNGQQLETTIHLGKLNCAAGATVEITFATETPELTAGLKCQFHRIQTAVADYKQKEAGMVYTKAVGFLEAAPLRLSYFPDEQSAIVDQFNDYISRLPEVLEEQMEDPAHRTAFMTKLGLK